MTGSRTYRQMDKHMKAMADPLRRPRSRLRHARWFGFYLRLYQVKLVMESRREGYTWREIRTAIRSSRAQGLTG